MVAGRNVIQASLTILLVTITIGLEIVGINRLQDAHGVSKFGCFNFHSVELGTTLHTDSSSLDADVAADGINASLDRGVIGLSLKAQDFFQHTMRVRRIGRVDKFAEFAAQALVPCDKVCMDFVSIQNLAAIRLSFDLFQRIGEESFEVHQFARLGFIKRRTIFDADDIRNNDAFSVSQFGKLLKFCPARHDLSRRNFATIDLAHETLNLNVAVFLGVEILEVNIFLLPVVTLDLVIGRET